MLKTGENEEKYETKVAEYIVNEIVNDELEFKKPLYKQVFEEIQFQTQDKNNLNIKYFLSHADSGISKLAVDLISPKYKESKLWKRSGNFIESEEDKIKQLVEEAVLAFKSFEIQKLFEKAQNKLIEAQINENTDEMEMLNLQYAAIKNLKIEIARKLGRRAILK